MSTQYQSRSLWLTTEMTSEVIPRRWLDRHFTLLLLVIAVAGLIPRLVVGYARPIGQDGWWHLFTATQDNWLLMVSEWKRIAHPPLFYPLLRFAALFGHSHLMLRSIGILCGCATTIVFGVIAARIYRFKASALLAAAAYTFAWSIIELNCDLRAYPIALLFVLLAFNSWLKWYADPSADGAGRAIVRFGAYSSLAILCEYYVVLFLAGCFGLLILRALTRTAFRDALIGSLRTDWKAWSFAAASPLLLFLTFFRLQQNYSLVDLPYIQPFIWNPDLNPGIDWFLLSNSGREIGYFTPFNIDPEIILPLICLLFIPALVYFSTSHKRFLRGVSSSAPPLLAALMLAQIIVLAVLKLYPFGGEFRHQSIVAPFLFLTAFLFVDVLAGVLKKSAARYALFSTVGALIAASFAFGWSVYPWNAIEQNSGELARFRQLFPNAENVYIDKVSTNFFYGAYNHFEWTFQNQFVIGGQRIVAYRLDDGKGHRVRLLRNKNEPWVDPRDPETYKVMAAALQHEHLKSAVFCFMSLKWDDEGSKLLEEVVRTQAPLAGLIPGRQEVGHHYLFVEFKLRDPSAP
jgi:hypothetical protein